MSELLNGIFECLDINSSTGLASEDSLRSMTPFQRLFYTQVHKKIGIDAVYRCHIDIQSRAFWTY